MKYKEIAPPLELQPYVKCLWLLNREYQNAEDWEVLWPDGCYELIFHFGARYEVDGQMMPKLFLIGSLTHYHELKAKGRIQLFGVRLKPWGLKAFTTRTIKDLQNQFLPLSDFFNQGDLDKLENSLCEKEPEEGVQLLLTFLTEILQEPQQEERHIIQCLSTLYENPVDNELEAIYKMSHYSKRQFERKTVEFTGLTPKKLSKVARFNQVRFRLFTNPKVDLHDCMQEYGYYDYAHFSKEFKESLGLTPRAYKSWMLEKQEVFKNKKDVVFLQENTQET